MGCGRATNADLYYDPVVDRHVASPIGLIAPAWYLGPQRPEMGEAAWEMLLAGTNVLSGELPEIWKEPGNLTSCFNSLGSMLTLISNIRFGMFVMKC